MAHPYPYAPQPPQQGYAHYQHQQAPVHHVPQQPAQRTVFGVPLGQGERVVYYQRVKHTPWLNVVLGIFLLPFLLLGIFVILQGAKMRKTHSWAHVITNRRLFTINAEGTITQEMAWSDVVGTYVRRRNSVLVASGVRNAAGRMVLFDTYCHEAEAFLDRVTANMRAIDSLPEPHFDAASLPVKPGSGTMTTGLVIGGGGGLTLLLVLAGAFNSSESLWVALLGVLALLGGGALAAIGVAKSKVR